MNKHQGNKIVSQLSAGIMRPLLLLIVLVILIFPPVGSADKSDAVKPYKAIIVLNKKNNSHLDFINSLNSRLKRDTYKKITTITYTIDELDEYVQKNKRFPDANIIVPVGSKAALSIKQHHLEIPVYFTLITSALYEMIEYDLSNDHLNVLGFSALFVNHPTEKHLFFIHHALPEINEACMITSHFRINKDAAYVLNLSLDILNKDDLHSRLPGILAKCSALLSSMDPAIYNNASIRNILITAYKYKTPVIGYSKALVKAGALMALYTSPQQIGEEVGEILIKLSINKAQPLPAPKSPEYFSIEFNYWVAQALNLDLPDKESLIKKLTVDFNKMP